jgi:uncharacterized membrane protein YgdD (TMEM256/DUF423 family)
MNKRLGSVGALLGALAVVAGAFGAHGLEDSVSPRRLDVWATASRYHLIHAVVFLGAWALACRTGTRAAAMAAWSMLAGIFVFSGSLYLLVLLDLPWMGAITPLGGLMFIVGWCALAVALWSLADARSEDG